MKYLIVFYLILLDLTCFGQDVCSAASNKNSDPEIVSFVDRLLRADMLNNTYEIIPCYEIPNFEAELFHNTRRIYYNPRIIGKDLKRLSFSKKNITVTTQDNWSLLTILAHEIGHHINDHFSPINSKLSPHSKELQADVFAGSLIYKIGGSLEQAILAYNGESEKATKTHPGRKDRITAIEKGWRRIDSLYQRNKISETILHLVIFQTNGKGKLYIDNNLINEIDVNDTISRNLTAGFYNIKFISSVNNIDTFSRRIKLVNPEAGQTILESKIHLDIASIVGAREEKGRLIFKQADSLRKLFGYQSAESKYREAAMLYNSDGMFMLGNYFLNGFAGLSKDEREAYSWYLRSANLGNADAMYMLGWYHRFGKGPVSKNIQVALDWYKRAIKLNSSSAMLELGNWYRFGGDGIVKNNQNAYEWYLRAASLNNLTAFKELGYAFKEGSLGLKKDLEAAKGWFTRGVDLKDPDCMVALGEIFLESGYEKQKGLRLIEEAARIDNNRNAIFTLQIIFSVGKYGIAKDGSKAIEWLKKLVGIDDEAAYSAIASIYHYGKGVEQNILEAIKWYKESVKSEHNDHGDYSNYGMKPICKVCNNLEKLGDLFYEGSGEILPKDASKAFSYYMQIEGYTSLELIRFQRLGHMYANGIGTKSNLEKAHEYFKRAAELGLSYPMNEVAWNYFNGNGVPKNIGTAKYWFEKAIESGKQVNSYFGLGLVHMEKGYIDFEKFQENMKKAGELGHKLAYFRLGDFYYTSLGYKDNNGNPHFFTDKQLSLHYFNLARKIGNINAIERIGRIYESGEKNGNGEWLIRRDRRLANELIEEACKNGLESSCKYLETKDWGNIIL